MAFSDDKFRKKKKPQRKKLLISILGLVIIFIFLVNGIIPILRQKTQIASLKQEIEKLKQENKSLMAEIKELKTNPSRIEDLARQMGMIRKGEKKVKFVPKED